MQQPTANDEPDTTYTELIQAKGRRARRRELDATREPGHLRKWFSRQGDPGPWEVESRGVFQQLMRSFKHSCHNAVCEIYAWTKRQDNRRERQRTKRELRKLR